MENVPLQMPSGAYLPQAYQEPKTTVWPTDGYSYQFPPICISMYFEMFFAQRKSVAIKYFSNKNNNCQWLVTKKQPVENMGCFLGHDNFIYAFVCLPSLP